MAIRARTVCRNVASVASRRLLHLYGDPTYPPSKEDVARQNSQEDSPAIKREGSNFHSILSHRNSSFFRDHNVSHRADQKRKVITVARHTVLGRMILNDPVMAEKHDLVAVPAWTKNKPWPPPPVKIIKKRVDLAMTEEQVLVEEKMVDKQSLRQKMQRSRTALKESEPPPLGPWYGLENPEPDTTLSIEEESEQPAEAEAAVGKGAVPTMRAITQMVKLKEARRKKAETVETPTEASGMGPSMSMGPTMSMGPAKSMGPTISMGLAKSMPMSASASVTNTRPADLQLAKTLFHWREKEELGKLFHRCAEPCRLPEVLTRRGMIKALHEAGYTPDTVEEQRCFVAVQAQILEHTRGKDDDPKTNPMTHAQGYWELSEFILLMEALHEIGARQMRLNNKHVADEFGMTIVEIEDLRSIFQDFDKDRSGSIGRNELKALLQEVDVATAMLEEDFQMLLESVGLDNAETFDFRQFLGIIVQVSRLLNQPVMSPVQSITSHPGKRSSGLGMTRTRTGDGERADDNEDTEITARTKLIKQVMGMKKH